MAIAFLCSKIGGIWCYWPSDEALRIVAAIIFLLIVFFVLNHKKKRKKH